MASVPFDFMEITEIFEYNANPISLSYEPRVIELIYWNGLNPTYEWIDRKTFKIVQSPPCIGCEIKVIYRKEEK